MATFNISNIQSMKVVNTRKQNSRFNPNRRNRQVSIDRFFSLTQVQVNKVEKRKMNLVKTCHTFIWDMNGLLETFSFVWYNETEVPLLVLVHLLSEFWKFCLLHDITAQCLSRVSHVGCISRDCVSLHYC
ncbi:hypothetical protein BDA99DRAFT_539177 [Phascolomyces articulosus]|uniref:Uncharacterized protein n=1 Tax=Phascolomyces articulosus TaxID=60185 RepID=A0AAD5JX78_9FUNG|nr:hypothetical protein BDA99DRAFT_539177 [Phascolomyces articulosus]